MKKLLIGVCIAVLCLPSVALAHKPLLLVEDNGDGTIYIETGFSDGSSGAGHKIILKNKETGAVLSEETIPEGGYIEEMPMPDVPYTVNFNAGPGHVVVKDGPFSGEAVMPDTQTDPAAIVEAADEPEPAPNAQKSVPAPQTESTQTVVTAAPAQQPITPHSSTVLPQLRPVQQSMPPLAAPTGPGAEMAMKMALTSQMITALAGLVVLGAAMFLVGYVVGKDAGKSKAA